jgi:hypothetical protein
MANERDQERRKRLASDEGSETAPEAPAAPVAEPEGLKPYHVRGPGAVFYGGKGHAPGAALNLSDEDAASLGDFIAPGHRPKQVDPKNPVAGKYKVTHHGSIWRGGKAHTAGAVLDLSAQEAAEFHDRIEAV